MQTNHSRQIREMQQKHGRKIADKETRHFDERQTATLIKGKPLEYAGELYSIRKLIYTTNTVEGYHRQIRKVTKNKGVFPSDTALERQSCEIKMETVSDKSSLLMCLRIVCFKVFSTPVYPFQRAGIDLLDHTVMNHQMKQWTIPSTDEDLNLVLIVAIV